MTNSTSPRFTRCPSRTATRLTVPVAEDVTTAEAAATTEAGASTRSTTVSCPTVPVSTWG